MILNRPFVFWILVWSALTLFFSGTLESLVISFYFVTFLMPVILSTSLVFNRYLVPKYLLRKKKAKFALYLTYLVIVSIYLELLVMVLAFVILADYQIENLGKIASDIYLLTIVLYLIVFVEGLVIALRKLKEREVELQAVSKKLENEKKLELLVKVDRKNLAIVLEDILFVESLGDYVKIHTTNGVVATKERISSLAERLPSSFIRIHRSFVINKTHVESFGKEEVVVKGDTLPIGRKYKASSMKEFHDSTI